MRFFIVWIYLGWKNITTRLTIFLYNTLGLRDKFFCFMLHHIDYRVMFWMSHVSRFLRLTSPAMRGRSAVAEANKRCLLGDEQKRNFTWVTQRRELLNLAVTYGENKQALEQLAHCSEKLNTVVEPLHHAGKPVILAPLHMISDVLTTMVGAAVYPGCATVITSLGADVYQEKERLKGGVNISYCSIHEDNKMIASNLMNAIMEAAEHKRNIMLFPDITPDYTVNTNKAETAKFKCQLFNRQARLHSGIIRLAKVLSAEVVFYHLYYDNEIKIRIYPPMASSSIKDKMPGIIEESISQYPDDWLLWHAHSLYFINE